MDVNEEVIDIYDLYKPFRNYMRQFSLLPSLINIWIYSQHIVNNMPLPSSHHFKDRHNRPVKLKGTIYPWELDILVREIILNSNNIGKKDLGNWSELSIAINHIRRIDDGISIRRRDTGYDVMLELHRITHRQFPWQNRTNLRNLMRYIKIFGEKNLEPVLLKETGLSMKEFLYLGLAVSGNFQREWGMSTNQDYTIIGISLEKSEKFYERLKCNLSDLRKEIENRQLYNEGWMYTWNPLNKTPLIVFDSKTPDRIICPMPSYIGDRISQGLFYDIFKVDGFDNPYGDAFQKYVGEVLYATCPLPKFNIKKETEYLDGLNRKDGADWILADETANIFIECKTKRMTLDAKFILTKEALLKDLDVMAAAIVQHYKNIKDAIDGKTKWIPNNKPIYPVIITLEDWFIFTPTVIGLLNDSVKGKLKSAELDEDVLNSMPYTVSSISEFEVASQVISQTGIDNFLSLKTNEKHKTWILAAFCSSEFKEEMKNIQKVLFEQEFEEMLPASIIEKRNKALNI